MKNHERDAMNKALCPTIGKPDPGYLSAQERDKEMGTYNNIVKDKIKLHANTMYLMDGSNNTWG